MELNAFAFGTSGTSPSVGISKHIGNVFEEGVLEQGNNVQVLHIAHSAKPIKLCSLKEIAEGELETVLVVALFATTATYDHVLFADEPKHFLFISGAPGTSEQFITEKMERKATVQAQSEVAGMAKGPRPVHPSYIIVHPIFLASEPRYAGLSCKRPEAYERSHARSGTTLKGLSHVGRLGRTAPGARHIGDVVHPFHMRPPSASKKVAKRSPRLPPPVMTVLLTEGSHLSFICGDEVLYEEFFALGC
jgi:hypothetical protein